MMPDAAAMPPLALPQTTPSVPSRNGAGLPLPGVPPRATAEERRDINDMRQLFRHDDPEQGEIDALRFNSFLTVLIAVAFVYLMFFFGGPNDQ